MKLLLVLCLLGCGEQCRVLAERVAVPVSTWSCSVAGVTIRFTGGPLVDASSDAGRVNCYEVVLP